MENELNPLQTVRRSIATLCLENEILRLLLQENWATAQTLSPVAVLNQGCKEAEAEFHSRSRSADTKLATVLSVPAPCGQILDHLGEWIQEARQQTFDRVAKARGTL